MFNVSSAASFLELRPASEGDERGGRGEGRGGGRPVNCCLILYLGQPVTYFLLGCGESKQKEKKKKNNKEAGADCGVSSGE